jgi:hypothetical protein
LNVGENTAVRSTSNVSEPTTSPSKASANNATKAPQLTPGDKDNCGTTVKIGGKEEAVAAKQEDEETTAAITKEPEKSAQSNSIEQNVPESSTGTISDQKATNIITQTSEPKPAEQEMIDQEHKDPTEDDIFEAYNNLFLTYYNKTPEIDTNNIQKALSQFELLLNVAAYYGSLPTVRLHINGILNQCGRELYKAILQNPPRWLFVSIYLESVTIFNEALIHIVGNYPQWPWKTFPQSRLTPEILEVIKNKVDELQSLRAKVNESLFMSTLKVEGKEVALGRANKEVLDTWCTVQLWRDWFCRALNRTKASRPTKIIDAAMYRTIAKGGDVYLPLAGVKDWREEYDVMRLDCAKWKSEDLEEDLAIMKRYAQEQVKPLLENRSMLSVEEEGIEYFTCTKVDNDELPWVKKAATPSPSP